MHVYIDNVHGGASFYGNPPNMVKLFSTKRKYQPTSHPQVYIYIYIYICTQGPAPQHPSHPHPPPPPAAWWVGSGWDVGLGLAWDGMRVGFGNLEWPARPVEWFWGLLAFGLVLVGLLLVKGSLEGTSVMRTLIEC